MAGRSGSAPGWTSGEAGPLVPRWLPNAISMLRIALVPLWVALAFDGRARGLAGREVDLLPVLLVLILLGASDVIDGTIARHFQLTSNLGATLDAVADKLAQVSMITFLAFFAVPAFTALPVWLWAALLLRDLLLGTGWVTVWRRRGRVEVEHRWHGKAASLLLFTLVLAATARAPELLILIGSAGVLAIMTLGTAAYLREGWRQLKGSPRAET